MSEDILPSSYPSRSALDPTQPHLEKLPGLFPGSKMIGAWRWQPTNM